MWTCRICRFETVLDDVIVATPRGTCICLRCFLRETGSARPISPALRRDLQTTLAALELV